MLNENVHSKYFDIWMIASFSRIPFTINALATKSNAKTNCYNESDHSHNRFVGRFGAKKNSIRKERELSYWYIYLSNWYTYNLMADLWMLTIKFELIFLSIEWNRRPNMNKFEFDNYDFDKTTIWQIQTQFNCGFYCMVFVIVAPRSYC